jgi:hypothetical protein
MKVKLHMFLVSDVDWGKQSASCFAHFIPRKRDPEYWMEGWVDLKFSKSCGKYRNHATTQNPTLITQPTASHFIDMDVMILYHQKQTRQDLFWLNLWKLTCLITNHGNHTNTEHSVQRDSGGANVQQQCTIHPPQVGGLSKLTCTCYPYLIYLWCYIQEGRTHSLAHAIEKFPE